MKRPLFALLPEAVQSRYPPAASRRLETGPRAVAWEALAVVAGAGAHVGWDAFTHRGRWGTRLVPGLNETALTVGDYAVPGFKILQYGSTLIGLPCLGLLLARWLLRRTPRPIVGGPTLSRSTKAAAWLVAAATPFAAAVWVARRGDPSA